MNRIAEIYAGGGVYYVHFQRVLPYSQHTPRDARRRFGGCANIRLYQTDYLLRHYGFHRGDIVHADGNLPMERDPKVAWALAYPE